MARNRRFRLEFKQQVVLDFLEHRKGLRELAREHNLSRNLLSQWILKYETGQLAEETIDKAAATDFAAGFQATKGQLQFAPLWQITFTDQKIAKYHTVSF